MSLEIEIVYEDDDIFCINKPAGVVVNRAATNRAETIQDWSSDFLGAHGVYSAAVYDFDAEKALLQQKFAVDLEYGDPASIFEERAGIAHRLDKETSGILLLAKHPAALLACMAQFKERTVQKTYTALTHGLFAGKRDTVSLPIGRSTHNRHTFTVTASGKPAVTEYSVEQEFEIDPTKWVEQMQQRFDWKQREAERALRLYQGLSLISCAPKTGRTHQIRVHCAYLQHPLVADDLYLGRKRTKIDHQWCPRHFLHASQLTLMHPRTGKQLTVEAPLASDLEQALEFVRSVAA